MELAKTDLAALPESERNILTLAGARLLMATAAVHTFEAVTATFECAGQSFTAREKQCCTTVGKRLTAVTGQP